MAKIQWSVLVGDARGTTGPVVASQGRFGATVRLKTSLPLRATTDQKAARAAFASFAQLWKSASMNAYRADWILLAANHPEPDVFGNLIRKTGCQYFTRANKTRNTFTLDPILAAPAFVSPTDPAAVTVSHTTGPDALNVNVTTPPDNGTEGVIIKATRGLSPGRTVQSNTAKIVVTFAPGVPPPWDILTYYTTKHGAPITDLQIFVQVYYVNTAAGYPGKARIGATIW